MKAIDSVKRVEHLENLTDLFELGPNGQMVSARSHVRKYCPHLTGEQISGLIKEALEHSVYFATPAVYVKGSYHLLCLSATTSELGAQAKRIVRIQYTGVIRMEGAYTIQEDHGDLFFDFRFSKAAIDYSEAHWPSVMVADDWRVYQEVRFSSKATTLYLTTREMVRADSSSPINELLSDTWSRSLARFTLNPVEGAELKGGRSEETIAYCNEPGATSHKVSFGKENVGFLPQAVIPLLKARGLL